MSYFVAVREVRTWLLYECASTKVHYCEVVSLSSVGHSKSIGFKTEFTLEVELCLTLWNLVPRAFPDLRVIKVHRLSQPVGFTLVVVYT